MATLIYFPNMAKHFKDFSPLFVIALLNMLAISNIPVEFYHEKEFIAFLSSTGSIVFLLALFAVGIFPKYCSLKSKS